MNTRAKQTSKNQEARGGSVWSVRPPYSYRLPVSYSRRKMIRTKEEDLFKYPEL